MACFVFLCMSHGIGKQLNFCRARDVAAGIAKEIYTQFLSIGFERHGQV